MQAAHQPAVLPLRRETTIDQTLPIALDFDDGEQGSTFAIENDGGKVVVEQYPLASPIRTAGQENLKRVVAVHADDTAAVMAQQRLHLCCPLRVRGAAQAKTMGEQACPVVTRPRAEAA